MPFYAKMAATLQEIQSQEEDRLVQQVAASSAAGLAQTLRWVSIGSGLAAVAVL